jgi:hypothetical protein
MWPPDTALVVEPLSRASGGRRLAHAVPSRGSAIRAIAGGTVPSIHPETSRPRTGRSRSTCSRAWELHLERLPRSGANRHDARLKDVAGN